MVTAIMALVCISQFTLTTVQTVALLQLASTAQMPIRCLHAHQINTALALEHLLVVPGVVQVSMNQQAAPPDQTGYVPTALKITLTAQLEYLCFHAHYAT
jgi:hypothetical protein